MDDRTYNALQLEAATLRIQRHHPRLVGSQTDVEDQLDDVDASIERLRLQGHAFVDDRLGVEGTLPRQLFWLLVAPYVDESVRDLIARANDNLLYHFVDGALCQRVLADAADPLGSRATIAACVEPGGRFQSLGLLTFARADVHPNPLHHELVPHADVVGLVMGRRVLSAPLSSAPTSSGLGIRRLIPERRDAVLLDHVLPPLSAVIGGWRNARMDGGQCVLLAARPGSGRLVHLEAVAADHGCGLLVARLGALHGAAANAALALDALCRESALHGDVVYLRDAGVALGARSPWAARLRASLERWPALVVCEVDENDRLDSALMSAVVLRQPLSWPDAPAARVRLLEKKLGAERTAAFRMVDRQRLGALTPRQLEHVGALLDAFEHAAHGTAEAAGADGASEAAIAAHAALSPRRGLELGLRSQLLADTGGMAAITQPHLALDELVLDDKTLDQVRHVVAAVRNRAEVLHGWGIAERIRRGLGICCLFDGEPGTGKTLAAEVVAGELGLQLMRIDVSSIVDKYVGETEKHLTRIFAQAQPETSLLLFDEADSLFSKRTEVKSASDHYANMSVNVLLQLIEAYEGVTVLTTNLKQSIDPAFERRIMFKIEFPVPEHEDRVRLWRHLLPSAVPTEDALDFEAMGEVEMTGGSIKNAILRAAYACARDGHKLTTDALLDAAYAEASASGRLVRHEVDGDF